MTGIWIILTIFTIQIIWWFFGGWLGIIFFNILWDKEYLSKSNSFSVFIKECYLTPFYLLHLCLRPLFSKVFKPLGSVLGEFRMKKFLFKYLVTTALGVGVWESGILTKAYQWVTAPPSPPSMEAQKLIASLEKADGWETNGRRDNLFSSNDSKLSFGNDLIVTTGTWWADIEMGRLVVDAGNSFTYSERRAINKAAHTCLRKLAQNALSKLPEKKQESQKSKGQTIKVNVTMKPGLYTLRDGVLYDDQGKDNPNP